MNALRVLVNGKADLHKVRKAIFVLFVAAFYVLISFMLYHKALELWWTHDDIYILGCVIFNNPIDFFWRPDVYQQLSVVNFTPMLILSYALDYSLFGFSAKSFYVHQIILIGLISTGIFLLVRRWRFWFAVWAGLFFLISIPVALGSHILMVRHYFEGGLWALFSILLFFSTDKATWKVWLAALSYLLAMLSKEVFVPFIIVFVFFSPGDFKKGLRRSAPCLLVLLIYIVWRILMIHRFGGYGDLLQTDSISSLLHGIQTLLSFFVTPADQYPVVSISLALLTAGLFAYLCFKRQGVKVLIGCVLLTVSVLGTLVPVWRQLIVNEIGLSFRLSIVFAILGSIAAGYFLSNFPNLFRNKKGRRIISVVSAIIVFAGLFLLWKDNLNARVLHWPSICRVAFENRYLYSEDSNTTLVSGDFFLDFAYLGKLRKKLKKEAVPAVCSQPFDFRKISGMRYFQFIPETEIFQDITKSFRHKRQQFEKRLLKSGPFAVNMEFGRGKYRIEIDPEFVKTQYRLLISNESNVYRSVVCPPKFSGQVFSSSIPIFLRVLKETEDGNYILSPEWVVDLKEKHIIRWTNDVASNKKKLLNGKKKLLKNVPMIHRNNPLDTDSF